MSNKICHLCLLLVAALLLVSCLDTDYTDEVTLYDDIAITQFQITSARVTRHTTSSTGEDSTYVADDQSVADCPFYIDQLNGEIYNVDKLPYGVDATKLLCEVYTKNNAMVFIENIARDSIRSLTSTDSVDFTQPRYLRAYASNAQSYRLYKVTVNVAGEQGDGIAWQRMADDAALAALGGMRLAQVGGRMVLLGLEGGSTVVFHTDAADGSAWAKAAVAFGPDTYYNMAVMGDTLFVLDGTTLLRSTDGEAFAAVEATGAPRRLVGASSTELYGIGGDGRMAVSADGGRTWQADRMDSPAALMPAEDISLCSAPYAYMDSTDYVVMAGNRPAGGFPGDSTAVVWRKVVEYAEGSEPSKWICMEADSHNRYQLPRLDGLTVLALGESKVAFGGAGIGACGDAPFERMYESRDGGITWQPSAALAFPDGFDTATPAFAAAADANGYVWIVCAGSGQVWRGRLAALAGEQ